MKTVVLTLLICALGSLPSFANEKDVPVYPDNPFVTNEAVYVAGVGISRYEGDTLARTWNALPGLQTFEPVVTRNAVLVGSTNGLYAVHRDTGVVRWHVASAMPVFSPVVVGEQAYAGSQDGFVRSVSLSDGSVIWEREFDGWIYPPVVHDRVLVVGGSEGILHGLSTQNGDVLWTKPLSQELVYRPVAAPGGVALVTTFSGDLIAVEIKDGNTVWQTQDSSAGFPPLVFEDRLYMGAFDGTLHVRDVRDGVLVWEYRFEETLPYIPRVVGDLVMIGSEHGTIAAINRSTGLLLWQKDLPYTLVSSPVVVADKVVVVVEGGSLLIVNDQAVASSY